MDVLFFCKKRIDFIEQLYKTSAAPYIERIRQIEAYEEPYIQPYSEDSEPAFLQEWEEANTSLQILAYSCISMLAASLHLYFETWVYESRVPVEESLRKDIFRNQGWLIGYKTHFSKHLSINFDYKHDDFNLLEEIVLARNRIEHPPSITSQRTQYLDNDLKKIRNPFFVDEREAAFFSSMDADEGEYFLAPTLHITQEQFLTAVSQVNLFTEWFENEITKRIYG